MRRIHERHIGLLVVGLALIVTAPRLAHAFMLGDGLRVDANAERTALIMTGIASGLVLTLGNAFLSHVLARRFDWRRILDWLMAGAWVIYLLFAVMLIAPALMVGMQASPLTSVLPETWMQWSWCIVAALSIEVLVAGSMSAYAIASRMDTADALTNLPQQEIPAPVRRVRHRTKRISRPRPILEIPNAPDASRVEIAPIVASVAPSKKHPCKQCLASFETPSKLASHVRWDHPKVVPSVATPNGNGQHA